MANLQAKWIAGAIVALGCSQPWTTAQAQSAALIDLPMADLRGEVQSRYDAALARSQDSAVINANSNVYIWASETKVQCGIALGFLRSDTRDSQSIRKCEQFYARMMDAPPVVTELPMVPPPPPPNNCPPEVASTFFFDWDSVVPPADASQSISFVADNRARCGWRSFTVVGHTDRSGSDAYNDGLSVRRANVIADMMAAAGIPGTSISVSGRGERELRVQTVDGERTPANRRVEVKVEEIGERQ